MNSSTKVLCLCVLLAPWLICMPFCHWHFFGKKSFGNTIRVANSLHPDQARHFITSITYNVTNPPRWNTVLRRGYLWSAVLVLIPYLWISINDLWISIIHLWISINHLWISKNHFRISKNHAEFRISIN